MISEVIYGTGGGRQRLELSEEDDKGSLIRVLITGRRGGALGRIVVRRPQLVTLARQVIADDDHRRGIAARPAPEGAEK